MLQSLEAVATKQRKTGSGAKNFGNQHMTKKTVISTEATDQLEAFKDKNSLDTKMLGGAMSTSSISKNTGSNTVIAREKLAQLQQLQLQQQMLMMKQSIFDRNRPWNCEFCMPKQTPQRRIDTKLHNFSFNCVASMVSRFMIKEEFYESRKVVELLNTNSKSVLVAQFKDYLIFDDIYEFLTAMYDIETSLDILTRHAVFYDSLSQLEVLCQYREDQIRDRHLVLHGLKPCYFGLEKHVLSILCSNFRYKLRIILNKVKKVQLARGMQIEQSQTVNEQTASSQISTPGRNDANSRKRGDINKLLDENGGSSKTRDSRLLRKNFKKLIHSSMVREYNFSRSESGLLLARDSAYDEQLITSIGAGAKLKFDTQSSINFTNISVDREVELLKGSVFEDDSIAKGSGANNDEKTNELGVTNNIESMYMNAQLILDDLSSRPLTRQSIPKTNAAQSPASRIQLYELHQHANGGAKPNVQMQIISPPGDDEHCQMLSTEGLQNQRGAHVPFSKVPDKPSDDHKSAQVDCDNNNENITCTIEGEEENEQEDEHEIMIVNEDGLAIVQEDPNARCTPVTASQAYQRMSCPHIGADEYRNSSKRGLVSKIKQLETDELEIGHIDRKSISFDKPMVIIGAQNDCIATVEGGRQAKYTTTHYGNSIPSVYSNELQPQTSIAQEDMKMSVVGARDHLLHHHTMMPTSQTSAHQHSGSNSNGNIMGQHNASRPQADTFAAGGKVLKKARGSQASGQTYQTNKRSVGEVVPRKVLHQHDDDLKKSIGDTYGSVSGKETASAHCSGSNKKLKESSKALKETKSTFKQELTATKKKSKKSSTHGGAGNDNQTPNSEQRQSAFSHTGNHKVNNTAQHQVQPQTKNNITQARGRGTPHCKQNQGNAQGKISPTSKNAPSFTLVQHKLMATSTRAFPRQNVPPGSKAPFTSKKGSMPATTSGFGSNFAKNNALAQDVRMSDLSARLQQHQSQHVSSHQHIDRTGAGVSELEKIKVSKKLIASIKNNIQLSPHQSGLNQGYNHRQHLQSVENLGSPTTVQTLSRQLAKGVVQSASKNIIGGASQSQKSTALNNGKIVKNSAAKRVEQRTSGTAANTKRKTQTMTMGGQLQTNANTYNAFQSERPSYSHNLLPNNPAQANSREHKNSQVSAKNHHASVKDQVILETLKKDMSGLAMLANGNSRSLNNAVKRTASHGTHQYLAAASTLSLQQRPSAAVDSLQTPSVAGQTVQLLRSQQLGGSMGPMSFAQSTKGAGYGASSTQSQNQKVDLYSIAGKLKLLKQPKTTKSQTSTVQTQAQTTHNNGKAQASASQSSSVPRNIQAQANQVSQTGQHQRMATNSLNRKNSLKLNSRKVSVDHVNTATHQPLSETVGSDLYTQLQKRGQGASKALAAQNIPSNGAIPIHTITKSPTQRFFSTESGQVMGINGVLSATKDGAGTSKSVGKTGSIVSPHTTQKLKMIQAGSTIGGIVGQTSSHQPIDNGGNIQLQTAYPNEKDGQYYSQRHNNQGVVSTHCLTSGMPSSPTNLMKTPGISSRNGNGGFADAQSAATTTCLPGSGLPSTNLPQEAKAMTGSFTSTSKTTSNIVPAQCQTQVGQLNMVTRTLNELQKHQNSLRNNNSNNNGNTVGSSSAIASAKLTTVHNSSKKKKIAKLNRAGAGRSGGPQMLSPKATCAQIAEIGQIQIQAAQILSPTMVKKRNTNFASVSLSSSQSQPLRLGTLQQQLISSGIAITGTGGGPSSNAQTNSTAAQHPKQTSAQKNAASVLSHGPPQTGASAASRVGSCDQQPQLHGLGTSKNTHNCSSFEQVTAMIPLQHTQHSRNAGMQLTNHKTTTGGKGHHHHQQPLTTTMPVSAATLAAAQQFLTSTASHGKGIAVSQPVTVRQHQTQTLNAQVPKTHLSSTEHKPLHSRKSSAVYSTVSAANGQKILMQHHQSASYQNLHQNNNSNQGHVGAAKNTQVSGAVHQSQHQHGLIDTAASHQKSTNAKKWERLLHRQQDPHHQRQLPNRRNRGPPINTHNDHA